MNNTTTTMDPRSERMLELLSEGASARVIAKKLGYSEGTMRVYLHNLYRAIGVRNKTEAVIWHLHRTRGTAAQAALPRPAPVAVSEPTLPAGNGFGHMALAEDLFTALGVMSAFVGPYGQLWEAGMRLKGTPMDETLMTQRAQSRLLWRALLKGDFAYGKLLYDEGHAERLAVQGATDAATIACLLALGGFSAAAGRLISGLGDKRKANAGVAAREMALMRAVSEAAEGKSEASLAALHALAAENGRAPALKQLAIAALYHVYRGRKQLEQARQTADALWAEAETARQQLEAMGVRPLAREAALPPLGVPDSIQTTSRKTALAR
jgi:DNA-binding CsgD family transcriptional regulator